VSSKILIIVSMCAVSPCVAHSERLELIKFSFSVTEQFQYGRPYDFLFINV